RGGGTPAHAPPGRAGGETKSAAPPADIYALGAILYDMLTGRPPFKGTSAIETVKQVIEAEPVSPSRIQFRVPRDLETICLKCLQKEPRKRYGTARELADDLNRYLSGEPIRARRTPPLERAYKWTKRHPTLAALLTLAVLGTSTLIGTGLWYWDYRRSLERDAERREANLREETAEDLLRAREALAKQALSQSHEFLAARLKLLERESSPGLASLADRTRQMLAEVEAAMDAERAHAAELRAQEEVRQRFRLF